MNMFTGGIVVDDTLELAQIHVPLPQAVKNQVRAGQELTLGVRPSAACLILDDRTLPKGTHLSGIVENVEPDYARHTQLAYLRTGSFFYAAQGNLEPILNVGDQVKVLLPADQLYFFDAESEQRIGRVG